MSREDRWLVLIDESADTDVYRIGAMVMRAGPRRLLRVDLDQVMQRAQDTFGVTASTELHAVEMYQGKGEWSRLQPRERIAVYGWALEAIAFHADAFLFEAVDREAFRLQNAGPHDNEHEAALQRTLEVIQHRAVERRQAAFVYADQCRFAASVVRSLEQSKRRDAVKGTGGVLFDRILHIEFVDSAANRQIQAIDLVTYLKQRIASGRDAGRPKSLRANLKLWERVAKKVAHDVMWPPSDS